MMNVHGRLDRGFRLEIRGSIHDLEKIAFGIAGASYPEDADGNDASNIADQSAAEIEHLKAEVSELSASLATSQRIAERAQKDLAEANHRIVQFGPDPERTFNAASILTAALHEVGYDLGVRPGEDVIAGIRRVFGEQRQEIERLTAEVDGHKAAITKLSGSGEKVIDVKKATTAALKREVSAVSAEATPQQPPPAPPPPTRPAPVPAPTSTAIGKVSGPTPVTVNIGALTITTQRGTRDIPTKPIAKALNHMSGFGMFGREKIRIVGGFVSDEAMMISFSSVKGALADLGLTIYSDKINIGLRAAATIGAA